MPTEKAVSKDDPMLIAWEKYKQTDYYQKTRKWASKERHVDGCLWASFVNGWKANAMETKERE